MLRPVSVRASAVASRSSSSQSGAPRKRGRPKSVGSPENEPSVLQGLCLLDHVASPTKLARRAEPKWEAHSDPKIDLPIKSEWTKHFPLRDRVCIRNTTTADVVAEAFVPHGSRGKVIVEAFPGMPVSVHSWVG
jgi:transcription factor 1